MSEPSATTQLPGDPQPTNEPVDPRTHPILLIDPLNHCCANHNCNPFAADPLDSRSTSDRNWFSDAASDSDHDVSCLVTDLFDRSSSEQQRNTNCVVDSGSRSDPFATELEIGGVEDGDETESNLGFGSNSMGSVSELGEFIGLQGADSRAGGLRIVGLELESDSDSGTIDDIESDRITDSGIQSIWDNLFLMEQRNMLDSSESTESNPVDGGVEELSVVSGFFTAEEEAPEGAARSLEWEIVNNFRRFADDDDLDLETAEYINTIFGQFVENANAMNGRPPAALSVVKDLPLVEFTVEELKKKEVVCPVCKDSILVEDKVRSLPCCHYYHHDCIVPWLGIRNTCPVCRYELPTDDPDYERSKRESAARGEPGDLQVRFEIGFEQFL
ncbi:E3 ubiquitin-protein ligase Praja-2 [Pyrus x bretschneideri]|uniref:E3 ubiquitin-protein ligase Praja-2 n=1 Tax=Pyrus x bretschneideri TaxID=225117 RepID=UPI00202F398F|nr:E3 ubiquitin-protein ligase Praja-2 [Pyrus x bretschneideri]